MNKRTWSSLWTQSRTSARKIPSQQRKPTASSAALGRASVTRNWSFLSLRETWTNWNKFSEALGWSLRTWNIEKKLWELETFSLKRSMLGSPQKHSEIWQKKSNGAIEILTGYLNFYFTKTLVKRAAHRGFGISIHRDNKTWATQELEKPDLISRDQGFVLGNG